MISLYIFALPINIIMANTKRETKKTYAVRIRPSVVARLDKVAESVHRDRSNMIEHIVNLYLANGVEDWKSLKELITNGR